MKITLLTVGKNGDREIGALIERYNRRLVHYTKFKIVEIPDVKGFKSENESVRKTKEGEMIMGALGNTDYVVLLDERGKELTSREFAKLLELHQMHGRDHVVFVVGGPYGFSERVYNRANEIISLSRLTLTHEMVRLFFVEQVYRAFTIIRGESYHHD